MITFLLSGIYIVAYTHMIRWLRSMHTAMLYEPAEISQNDGIDIVSEVITNFGANRSMHVLNVACVLDAQLESNSVTSPAIPPTTVLLKLSITPCNPAFPPAVSQQPAEGSYLPHAVVCSGDLHSYHWGLAHLSARRFHRLALRTLKVILEIIVLLHWVFVNDWICQ